MIDSSYTVLIVDDSSTNRSYLAHVLEEDGYRTIPAASGEEGLAIAAEALPALILLDVIMPGFDGFETLRRLKEGAATRRIPVIMLTSLDDQESKLRAFEFGAVDYIVKSANEAEVRARVRVHIRLALSNERLVAALTERIRLISAAQRSLLVRPEDLPEARFSVYYRSLQEAGGDFYDVLSVSDEVFFYFMADVAGHDVATSYVTPAVKVLLKQCATPAYSMPEVVAFLNDVLTETLLRENYLTAFALRINRKAAKAVYVAAGHPPALFIPREGPVGFAASENPFIGMIKGSAYNAESMDIREGDRLVLYTDGLVESGSEKKTWPNSYGRLAAVGEKLRGIPLGELPAALVREMGAEAPDDDVAVLAVEV